jgi:S1-C subfamily serine protease
MIADELISKGSVTAAYMGLEPKDVPEYLKKEKNINGGAVVASEPSNDGPAGIAGIHKNDIILQIGEFQIRNEQDLRDAMYHFAPGSSVQVQLLRGSDHKTVTVKLGNKKDLDDKMAKEYKQQAQGPQNGQGFMQMPPGFNFPDGNDFGQMIPHANVPNGDQAPHTGHARLGVTVDNINDTTRSEFGLSPNVQGAVVTSVAPGSVAESLGIQPGYVIQQVGSTPIHSAEDVQNAMKGVNWGDTKSITFGKFTPGTTMTQTATVTFK